MRALFRVDAGPQAGLGHLRRCLSLALALREHGCESAFAVPAGEELVGAAGFAVGEAAADVVVVDSYHAGPDDLRADVPVVFVDDRAAFPVPCDLVVNGGAHARGLAYRGAPRTRFLLGPEYALLRPEFWETPPREARSEVERILVLAGGSDPLGLAPLLLVALEPLGLPLTAVVGPLARNRAEVEAVAAAGGHEVVVAPAGVLALMRRADLAVSAAGQTLYELAAAGTPAVAVRIADNQEGNLRALAAAGAVRSAGRAGEGSLAESVLENCVDLVGSLEARRRLAAAGQRLVDGRGALRAAAAIAALARRQAA